MTNQSDRSTAEARFRVVFGHLGSVTAYARRRGSDDPEGIAAEVMAIAWRKLASVPSDDARPWLFATARNLLLAEWRQRRAVVSTDASSGQHQAEHVPPESVAIGPELTAALRSLSLIDREALLLIAWEDLSPKLAARVLGMRESAFRVRLHRARRRFRAALATFDAVDPPTLPNAVELENG